MSKTEKETEVKALVTIESNNALAVFSTDGGLDPYIAEIEKEVKAFVPDISTEKGRKEIASLAYRVARTKTALDELGKDLTEDWKKKAKIVDAERKKMREKLDALKDEARAPLTEWENAEKARIQAHEDGVTSLEVYGKLTDATVSGYEEQITALQEFYISREWEEFKRRAELNYNDSMMKLKGRIEIQRKADADRAELERLRKEEEERKKKEELERIAREAAEKARVEAEEKARKAAEEEAARVKAEQEAAAKREAAEREAKEKAEREKAEAEERARKAEEEKRLQAERFEREKAEAAERARIASEQRKAEEERAAAERARLEKEAEERRAREKKEADERAAAQAKAAADAAAKAERERIEAERLAAAAEDLKRQADNANREKVNNAAISAIKGVLMSAIPVDEEPDYDTAAKAIIEEIARGQIPHVKITY